MQCQTWTKRRIYSQNNIDNPLRFLRVEPLLIENGHINRPQAEAHASPNIHLLNATTDIRDRVVIHVPPRAEDERKVFGDLKGQFERWIEERVIELIASPPHICTIGDEMRVVIKR